MNCALASECTSGVESGWTLYLEHSFISQNNNNNNDDDDGGSRYIGGSGSEDKRGKDEEEESDEDDDLSMVSDASSWPPHFPHDDPFFNQHDNGCFYSASKADQNVAKKQKVKENIQHSEMDQNLSSFLHDTASSHVFDFSMNGVDATNRQTSTESMLDYSQGFSATYIQRRPSFQEHFGFLQQSISEKELHGGNKWYGRRGIGMR